MRRGIIRRERLQHVVDLALLDVHQHIRIRKLLDVPVVRLSSSRREPIDRRIIPIIVLQHLLVRHRDDPVIIVLEPPPLLLRLDQGKVMPSVQVSGVDEDTVELVVLGDASVGGFAVQVWGKVDVEGELMASVDLTPKHVTSVRVSVTSNSATHLAHRILLHIILEPPQLQMQHRRKLLEDHTFLRILQPVSLRLVLVLSLQRLDLDVVLERFLEIAHALDRELNICHARQVSLVREWIEGTGRLHTIKVLHHR